MFISFPRKTACPAARKGKCMKKSVIVPPKTCADLCKDCSNHCEKKIVQVPTVEQALDLWLGAFPPASPAAEIIPLSQGAGRVLAEPVFAKMNVPVDNCATHDGIAIHFESCEAKFKTQPCILQPDEFFHCPMGTAIPEPFDSIAHAEQCRIHPDGTATLMEMPVQYQSVKIKGTYVGSGEKLADADEVLSPSHLALMQYTGHTSVLVKRKTRLSIIPVGNDLVLPGQTPASGQYIECDSIYIQAVAAQYGGEAAVLPIVPDDSGEIADAMSQALQDCDILVVIGGVGKGEMNYGDHTLKAVREMGKILCHGVQLGPGGKNMLLAQISGKPVLGIPGPPHAAIIMTEYFLPPIFQWHLQCAVYRRPEVEAVLEQDFPSRGGGTNIWEPRIHLRESEQGYTACLVGNMGETVENFITASASVAVTGDLSQYKKGKKVKARLLHNKYTFSSI